jgi:hypothetical protein
MMRGAAGVLAIALALCGAVAWGCSPRTRGDGDAMDEVALRETAAEAMAQQASVGIALRSGDAVRGEIGGVDENGIVLVETSVNGCRPRERTLAWGDMLAIDVERPLGNGYRLLVLGVLLGVLATLGAVGRAVSSLH